VQVRGQLSSSVAQLTQQPAHVKQLLSGVKLIGIHHPVMPNLAISVIASNEPTQLQHPGNPTQLNMDFIGVGLTLRLPPVHDIAASTTWTNWTGEWWRC
jgi:hypothetical protein